MSLLTARGRRVALIAVLVAASSAASQLTAGTASACILDVIALESIRVDARSVGRAYEAGDVAEVRMAVTRPGREDAAGLGVPVDSPVSRPAEGIDTGVFVTVGDEFVHAFGTPTDADGEATARFEVPPVGAGSRARILAVAWKTQVQGPCFVIVEQGSMDLDRAFVITG